MSTEVVCPFRGAHKALVTTAKPTSFRGLQTDHRGYPVPYVVMQDPPKLAVIDPRRFHECAQLKLCGVCGRRLGNKKWFLGGESSSTCRLFTFPAQHEECARYALRACPFITNPKMKYGKVGSQERANPNVDLNRPDHWFLLRTSGYKVVVDSGWQLVKANDWDYLECWKNGLRIEYPFPEKRVA